MKQDNNKALAMANRIVVDGLVRDSWKPTKHQAEYNVFTRGDDADTRMTFPLHEILERKARVKYNPPRFIRRKYNVGIRSVSTFFFDRKLEPDITLKLRVPRVYMNEKELFPNWLIDRKNPLSKPILGMPATLLLNIQKAFVNPRRELNVIHYIHGFTESVEVLLIRKDWLKVFP